jgi:hypothetical protein
VGLRAVLDAVVRIKIPSLYRDSIIQPVAQRYTTEPSRIFLRYGPASILPVSAKS